MSAMRCRQAGLATALLALATCQARSKPLAVPGKDVVLTNRYPLSVAAQGLSGLAAAPDGGLWAVAERDRVLIRLAVGSEAVSASSLQLGGIEDGLDSEALAVLDSGDLLIGTETMAPWRGTDRLLEVRIRDGRAEVSRELEMSYALWNTRGETNKGIEGLCAAGDIVLAGAEIVIDDHGRWAPVGRLELASGAWTPFRLGLASDSGKLSSLACRRCGDMLEALAIERHYGVALLHFFTIPAAGPGADVTSHWVADLGAVVPGIPNMEGIEWLADGSMVVLVDNDTGGVRGPNELLRMAMP